MRIALACVDFSPSHKAYHCIRMILSSNNNKIIIIIKKNKSLKTQLPNECQNKWITVPAELLVIKLLLSRNSNY